MSSRLILFDALGLVYRAYHAIPPLSTQAGIPTNALLGFIKTVRSLQQHWQPGFSAVVFDGGIPPARRELLPLYKAQRPPMPDGMRAQLPLIQEYLSCAGVAAVRRDAIEADDILATLAVRAADAGMDALVVTADKDLMQIVSDKVALITPGKMDDKVDPAAVRARAGVRPDQIVDWLALAGDNADNIPGVPGVGPKTAARWLEQWSTLDGILAHQAELQPEKCRQALVQHLETVRRNVALMRLQVDLPDLPELEELRARTPDFTRLLAFYQAHELHALARDLAAPTLF